MEKAIYLTRLDSQHGKLVRDYDRLYYGAEFCEIKIPSAAETAEAAAFAKEHSVSFTLVTPFVTDRGLGDILQAVESLPENAAAEIVINDYGTLKALRAVRPDLTLVFGRLLVNQKRGFGISSHTADAGPELADQWQKSGVDTPILRTYLENLGIHRVELDNLVQGIGSDFSGSTFKASVYYPYGYATTTRYCPWAFNGKTWPNLKGVCSRPCLQGMIEEKGEMFNRVLFLAGNAQFFRNDNLPEEEDLLKKGIDRIVFEPDIPV